MYDELKKTNENNLTIIQGMRTEFVEESDQMEKKYQFIDKNNPFEQNIKLVEKNYNDIISVITQKRDETVKKMEALRDNYMKNIQQNIDKVKNMTEKANSIEKRLLDEIKKMGKQM